MLFTKFDIYVGRAIGAVLAERLLPTEWELRQPAGPDGPAGRPQPAAAHRLRRLARRQGHLRSLASHGLLLR